MKNLVALIDDHPQRIYFVNKMSESFNVKAVFVVQDTESAFLRRVKLFFENPYKFSQKAVLFFDNLLQKTLDDAKNEREQLYEQILGDHWKELKVENIVRINRSSLNATETVNKIRSFTPDILIVCSTPILKRNVLSCPQEFCLNFHKGLIPYYRGTNCLYWPIYHGRYDLVGITIHQMTEQVDAGMIANQAQYIVEPGDTFLSIQLKAAKLGTDLMIKTLQQIEDGTIKWTRPDLSKGRIYYYKEFTYKTKREVVNKLKVRGLQS